MRVTRFMKSRRTARVMNRPNPFMHLREDRSEMPSDDEEIVERIKVTSYFEGSTLTAKLLMSDGSELNADEYTPGGNGFVVAKWLSQLVSKWSWNSPTTCWSMAS